MQANRDLMQIPTLEVKIVVEIGPTRPMVSYLRKLRGGGGGDGVGV